MIRFPWRFVAASLLTAWAVDFLFWQKQVGISFIFWVIILFLGAIILYRGEGVKISRNGFILMGAILVLAAGVFFRLEPFTRGFGMLLAVGLIWLLASTFLSGYWVRFRIFDYISAGVQAAVAGLVRPLDLSRPNVSAEEENSFRWKKIPRKILPYLRGLLLALPILFVMGGLLVAADPIFSGWVENWLKIFNLQWLGEYLFRAVYILILAYLFVGLYLYAIKPKREAIKPDPDKPLIKGFLGWPETAVVLGSINVLFAIFLVVQMRYFFGGSVNISETGYTYSEYARRGFGELVAVAVLSLLLYLGLSIVAKLNSKLSRSGFTVLSFLLIAQVMVILVSAFQRLLLYEDAYGFTRLRMYSHVFMVWLGIILVAALVLEIVGRRGWFALALLISTFGFAISLTVINVDGQVVRRNVARSVRYELDPEYLKVLSSDAVPAMADLFQNVNNADIKEMLGMQLACRKSMLEDTRSPWQAFTWSEASAKRILSGLSESLSAYSVINREGEWLVGAGGKEQFCAPQVSYFD